MLIAKQKRKQNLAEYILYLFQIEDLIRAFRFDMDLIRQNLVTKYQADEATSKEIADWYENLVLMMEKEQIRESGHLRFLLNLINDLNEFHLSLISRNKDDYKTVFQLVAPILAELKQKNTKAENDISLALDTIYGYLLLKIKNSEISNSTAEAVQQISKWLGKLSAYYKEYEEGKLDLN